MEIDHELHGPNGRTARLLPPGHHADHPAVLAIWIITAPDAHPLWSQYALSAVTLADLPGVPEARKRNDTVTHELTVLALNPDHGPYDNATVERMRYLGPVNVVEQFTATDEHARELTARAPRRSSAIC
jgi:hypothetical protein